MRHQHQYPPSTLEAESALQACPHHASNGKHHRGVQRRAVAPPQGVIKGVRESSSRRTVARLALDSLARAACSCHRRSARRALTHRAAARPMPASSRKHRRTAHDSSAATGRIAPPMELARTRAGIHQDLKRPRAHLINTHSLELVKTQKEPQTSSEGYARHAGRARDP